MKSPSNNFDVIVGVPQLSGQYATEYAKKWNLLLYLVIFESPNWVVQFRDGDDSTEEFWEGYKKCLRQANTIIVPSHESKKHLQQWLDIDVPIKVVYPCINEIVAHRIKQQGR